MISPKAALVFLLAASGAAAAWAQAVALQGMLGRKALLIVDGSEPRTVAPGDTFKGVKVISTTGDSAVVEIAGRQHTLRVGDAPASVGGLPMPTGDRIVLTAGSGGHFITGGRINGQQAQFIVDTGATTVAMSVQDATRLGIPYKEGRMGLASTANGTSPMWLVKLASVRIGDVEVRNVDASVMPGQMPYVLLGNSFLTRFQMKRENETMVLERRY